MPTNVEGTDLWFFTSFVDSWGDHWHADGHHRALWPGEGSFWLCRGQHLSTTITGLEGWRPGNWGQTAGEVQPNYQYLVVLQLHLIKMFHLAGFLWLLLGLQCSWRSGRATQEDYRCPGVPQSSEFSGLLCKIWQPGVQWWLHDKRLPICH